AEPLLQRSRLALEERGLGARDFDLGGGAGGKLCADEALVFARDGERLLGLVAQRAGRLEVELGAAKLVLDAHRLPAGLRLGLADLTVGVLEGHVAEAAVVEREGEGEGDGPGAGVYGGGRHRVVVAAV